jgi:hypothetical protein
MKPRTPPEIVVRGLPSPQPPGRGPEGPPWPSISEVLLSNLHVSEMESCRQPGALMGLLLAACRMCNGTLMGQFGGKWHTGFWEIFMGTMDVFCWWAGYLHIEEVRQ